MKNNFNISAKGLSLQNALALAQLSDLAYENLNNIEERIKNDFGLLAYRSFDKKDTQAFVAADSDKIILAFRGTDNINDWSTNIRTKLVSSLRGYVHKGFSDALDFIWEELIQTILDLQDRQQQIWITGHSLGGALATLAADRLTENKVSIDGLYTFGQPRTGDKIFAHNLETKIGHICFRFVHDEDVVPTIPKPFQGYRHIKNECYFDREGILHTSQIKQAKFFSRCNSVALRSLMKAKPSKVSNPGSIGDHGMAHYIRRIRENLRKEHSSEFTFDDYINMK